MSSSPTRTLISSISLKPGKNTWTTNGLNQTTRRITITPSLFKHLTFKLSAIIYLTGKLPNLQASSAPFTTDLVNPLQQHTASHLHCSLVHTWTLLDEIPETPTRLTLKTRFTVQTLGLQRLHTAIPTGSQYCTLHLLLQQPFWFGQSQGPCSPQYINFSNIYNQLATSCTQPCICIPPLTDRSLSLYPFSGFSLTKSLIAMKTPTCHLDPSLYTLVSLSSSPSAAPLCQQLLPVCWSHFPCC